MWFELNLIKKGLVSIDEMLAAVKRQRLTRAPIGRVAIEQGKMSMAQVFEVLKQQADDPRPFGQTRHRVGLPQRRRRDAAPACSMRTGTTVE